ncbi:MAG: hypothetical protein ACOYK9_03880 [Chlamydiia bacterium]
MNKSAQECTAEEVVQRQLIAYNEQNYEEFASCYLEDIISYHLETSLIDLEMSGSKFFDHYREKFTNNPNLHCRVTNRMVHKNLIVDHEILSGYNNRNFTDLVIYQVDDGKISKMWFTKLLPMDD